MTDEFFEKTMKNKYVGFISDEHLFKCIENLYASYLKAKEEISKKKFYNNKIDTIKLTFDTKFNNIDEKSIIETEILRQIDKSITTPSVRFTNKCSAE